MVVKVKVDLDGAAGSAEEERMRAEHILKAQKADVRAECHFAHAVSMEVELVFDDLDKMLPETKNKNYLKTTIKKLSQN